ncbi:DUF3291 domain-containing protein [Pelagibius marinus]|uniref:DUF3291 domain-containing protein n=1 Tax=Pelagibius marinus TaxID=2762760 RepID=UPI00187307B4|nr:DUF3291 domain-containing protein [Pelagibius marinus]
MSRFHLAQINVARALAPLDDPRLAGFVERLDDINALADGSPGFVWRLQSDSGNATDIQVSDDPKLIVNMSVWEDLEALFAYVYRSDHLQVMAQRRQWFEKPTGAFMALWWLPAGELPSAAEGMRRLAILDHKGPTSEAFTFKAPFDAAGQPIDRGALVRQVEPCA